jgi:hypothetical protein
MIDQATEGGVIETPARSLSEVLADLHRLEKELVHHLTYQRWRRAATADDLGDAVILVRNARRTCLSIPPVLSVCRACEHLLVGGHPQSGGCIMDNCSCDRFVR